MTREGCTVGIPAERGWEPPLCSGCARAVLGCGRSSTSSPGCSAFSSLPCSGLRKCWKCSCPSSRAQKPGSLPESLSLPGPAPPAPALAGFGDFTGS